MAARTAMGKIGKIDFFACLPSGAYAFLCLYLAFSIVFGLEEDSKRVVVCKPNIEKVSNDKDLEEKIKNFKSEFESKKKCEMLIVHSTSAEDKWTIAGFDDKKEFKRKLIDNPGSELLDELKKTPVNERKIAELATSKLELPPNKNHGIWNAINQLITKTSKEPTSLLLIIFSAYLLGSIFRALPVSLSEYDSLLGNLKFPYGEKIKKLIKDVGDNDGVSQVKKKHLPVVEDLGKLIPPEKDYTLLAIYNYWKDVICISSPEGFAYYQEFEARTRFFSGMFFSGLFGIMIVFLALFELKSPFGWENISWENFSPLSVVIFIISVIMLLYVKYKKININRYLSILFYFLIFYTLYLFGSVPVNSLDDGHRDLFILFFISLVIVITYTLNVNHVRTQEARTLTGLYLAYKQSESTKNQDLLNKWRFKARRQSS